MYDALHIAPGQLEALTGIRERRWWKPNTPISHGAIAAAKKALQEYLEMKSVAEQLANRNLLGETTFVRSYSKEAFAEFKEGDPVIQVGLFELIDAFQKILDNIPEAHRINMDADAISVKEKISEIVDILERQSSITFYELFSAQAGKGEIIVTFLALLEMVKLGLVQIMQHVPSGIIRVFYL